MCYTIINYYLTFFFSQFQEIGNLREIAKEKMELFEDAEQFLKHQISNNKELDENIEQLEKKIFFDKGEQKKLSETIVTFESEVIELIIIILKKNFLFLIKKLKKTLL